MTMTITITTNIDTIRSLEFICFIETKFTNNISTIFNEYGVSRN